MIRNENFCLPTSYDIIKFCIWRDNLFSLNSKAIEKCGMTVFEIVSPTADFETIKNGISLVARLLVIALFIYPQFKLWLHTIWGSW